MPSKTPKQARFMAAAAHSPSFAKKAGIKQSVAKEFNQTDARKKKAKRNRMIGSIAKRVSRTYA